MVAVISCDPVLRAKKPDSRPYPKELKTIGDLFKKRRLDLNLQQKELAERLRVTVCTLRNWEKGRSCPETRYMPQLIDFLGYWPCEQPCRTLGQAMLMRRKRLGPYAQKQPPCKAGLSPGNIAAW